MDPLKHRIGAFTEGILIMSCPVLMAVSLKKVDLRSEGNSAVRSSISPLAAISLLLCSLAFVFLSIANALRDWLPNPPSEFVFRFCKLLVHVCAVLQMVLAYMILLLIAMRFEAFLALLVVFGPFILVCCYVSVVRSEEDSARVDEDDDSCDKKLEPSLDFSVAVTSLLFLGLEGLALEGQTVVGQDLDPHLRCPLGLTFVFCVMSTTVMLVAAVPPIVDYSQEVCNRACVVLHALCGFLTICFSGVVLTIVFVLEKEVGVMVAVVPCLVLFLFYVGCLCVPGGGEPVDDKEVKPPVSMEMTKVTFTGFLAVSLPSFRDGSLSSYTHIFIISTAMAVLFGLAWRFLTHFKQRAAVWTAKVACLSTYACLVVAAVPFMLMAMQALADADDDDQCHVPCTNNSTASAQLLLFIKCFNQRARQTSSYALSSVNC
ncbi:hypothetical protein BS78_03G155600 [Paspalum vaginatum]|nr:hypothetical protein BS78_03G155600 [Paspalum vaginatum]KAJ1283815.1 hypothetical protein BS78_03G155600 [Paspalum vaginatum]KAJ1283816.1 hypothetical protein BS78_03G155600 [Paspalum vaginatum]